MHKRKTPYSISARFTMQQPRFLNNLQKGRHAEGITTRVVRKWTHYENMGQGPPLYVGMVLADAKVPSSPTENQIRVISPKKKSIHYIQCYSFRYYIFMVIPSD